MNAEIVTVGDEILLGHVVNTNAAYIGRSLAEVGVTTKWVSVVGDDPADMREALEQAISRADIVIITGGLGPTHDDVTRDVVSEFFSAQLVPNQDVLDSIRKRFEARGLTMSKANERQTLVPEGAQIIPNTLGTAPGLLLERTNLPVFILPGVPAEMESMMHKSVIPFLQGKKGRRFLKQRVLHTTGIPESTLYQRIGDVEKIQQYAKIGFQPTGTRVDIRLSVEGKTEEQCLDGLQSAEERIRARVGRFIYATDVQTMEDAVAELLVEKGKTIAVAESCTGGLLAHKLTNVSGSSKYFERGVVSYSNQAKMDILGVPEQTLKKHGAVSSETAIAMAEGVRRIAETDLGISTTGIAGPTGGTPTKPVGVAYIGFADGDKSFARRFVFRFGRVANKERSVMAALDILRKYLISLELHGSPS